MIGKINDVSASVRLDFTPAPSMKLGLRRDAETTPASALLVDASVSARVGLCQ
jgi:hypothetical protein